MLFYNITKHIPIEITYEKLHKKQNKISKITWKLLKKTTYIDIIGMIYEKIPKSI